MSKKLKKSQKSGKLLSQSFEPGAELVPSVNPNDSTHSHNGEKTMSINFDTLSKAEQQKSVDDHERYQDLLRDLAAGKERKESEILEILERVSRNVNTLKEDYEWRSKRDAMIAEVRRT